MRDSGATNGVCSQQHPARFPLTAETGPGSEPIRLPSGMAEHAQEQQEQDDSFTPSAPLGSRPLPLWRHMLGEELRRLRHERDETLGETAASAGVSPQYLSEMERGVKDPSSEMIAAVAGALQVTLIDLTLSVAENLQAARPAASRAANCQAAFALAA